MFPEVSREPLWDISCRSQQRLVKRNKSGHVWLVRHFENKLLWVGGVCSDVDGPAWVRDRASDFLWRVYTFLQTGIHFPCEGRVYTFLYTLGDKPPYLWINI